MSRDLLMLLTEATIAGTAAIALVLLLRRPLRAWFGVGAVYAAWLLVPAALVAVAIPAAIVPVVSVPTTSIAVAQGTGPAIVARDSLDPGPWLVALWALGTLAAAARLLRQQRRFLAGLGRLQRRPDGLYQSDVSQGLPAVVGWRARIVLPADFEQRYEPGQQQLVLCHERVHQGRGDLWANAMASVLGCVFWFNPIVHVAARRFRYDQELACDAVVLARFPHRRRTYGDALLKSELADHPLPVGCHGFGSHPLKERIAMLKHPLPSKKRWIAGLVLVALLTAGGGWTAWAAQPARIASAAVAGEGDLAVTLKVSFDGRGEKVDSVNVSAGQARTFSYDQDGHAWEISLTLKPLDDGTIQANADISRDGVIQGQPVLVFRPETGAAIRIGEGDPGAGFKGIAMDLQVARRATANVSTQGDLVSVRDAATEIAAGSGLRLANPEVLPADRVISFRFDDIPAVTALELIAEESGLILHVAGDQVSFEKLQGGSLQKPRYPAGAAAAGEGGLVMLKVLVGTDGQPREIQYVAGESTVPEASRFTRNALEAAAQWKFQPSTKDGKAVPGWVKVPVRFEASGLAPAGDEA
ncbi:hypothetical protein GCM10011521_01880 [Arenimonas soli]|uniref:TonB C-terminal domain-containing protein n=1 Tax=Arenimonas soli TaxID=2269504 RepID=A0ABQ1HB28_9GAMM|nr:TonB family protein [Arenimonas soli]GGA67400.1 hypothetical protein GCM10011521_01880 [Arenimonas soli]